MLNQEFMNTLSPVELQFFQSYAYKLIQEKVSAETQNYENLTGSICECPACHCRYIRKNGTKNHRQRYECKNKDCKHRFFTVTTGTFFYHSKSPYHTWLAFLGCELNHLTLEQEAVVIGRTVTTCFNMRHTLYSAVSKKVMSVSLSGITELDATYTKINLKGTKAKNMPRISKERGKHKTSLLGKNLAGVSHHKVCIITAMDEHDNILYRIGGLGNESTDKYMKYKKNLKNADKIISDSSKSIRQFAETCHITNDQIPCIAGEQHYTTKEGDSLGDVNELHTELKNLMRKYHGISTRHLQGYLDWITICKKLKYTTEAKRRSYVVYMDTAFLKQMLTTLNICSQPQPVSLYDAYSEYHYGIFGDFNQNQHLS